jgi:uncharacterized iron-regulated membrane protein
MEADMTDRELLKLAAKAAGIDVVHQPYRDSISIPTGGLSWRDWNPLADDGDALGLVSKLALCVSVYRSAGIVTAGNVLWASERYCSERFDKGATEDEIRASARRAITRAAAEIGRSA